MLTVPKLQLRLEQPEAGIDDVIDLPILFSHTQSGHRAIQIGRHRTNNVVLPDCERLPLLVSRHHVEFVWNDNTGEVEVHPHPTSTNGTYVNNMKLNNTDVYILTCGDWVSFGGPTYVIRNDVCTRNPFLYKVVESEHDYIVVDIRPSDCSTDTVSPMLIKHVGVLEQDTNVEDVANMLVNGLNSRM